MLSGVSLLTVSNVNNPVGLVGLPCVMWSAHFFVTHIQTEKISSWNGLTIHVCCFMLARASTKTFVTRTHIRQLSPKNSEKIFVSRKIRQQGHSLAEVSLYCGCQLLYSTETQGTEFGVLVRFLIHVMTVTHHVKYFGYVSFCFAISNFYFIVIFNAT